MHANAASPVPVALTATEAADALRDAERRAGNHTADFLIVHERTPWLVRRFLLPTIRRVVQSFLSRAFEQGRIGSYTFHELMAMVDRCFPLRRP